MKIAICAICYNRLNSLKRLLGSLEKAYYDEPVTLIISIDKSNTTEIEEFADLYKWTKGELRVIKHEKNLGLRNHILSCGEHLHEFDAIIVLEDDVYVTPSFYFYSRECVEQYYTDSNIAGISLFNYPLNYHCNLPFMPMHSDSDVFLFQSACSWGQVWMKQQWFDFMNWYKNHSEEFSKQPHLPDSICSWPKSSWLKYHTKYCIETNKYFIFPYTSLTTCFCDVGTHATKKQTHTQSIMVYGEKKHFNLNPTIKYDVFFEAESIYAHFGLSKDNLCVDLFGEKKNREKRRYYLTRKQLPYRVIKSYALDFKPWELNVLNDLEGHEIFLYDTTINDKALQYKNNKVNADYYLYMTYIDPKNVFSKSLYNTLRTIKHKLFG